MIITDSRCPAALAANFIHYEASYDAEIEGVAVNIFWQNPHVIVQKN